MSKPLESSISEMRGGAALPRENGELVFENPWEARAFGIAVVLNNQGTYPWRDFSAGLAEEIGSAESSDVESTYYERWLASLVRLAIAMGLISEDELENKTHEIAETDDHDHPGTEHQVPNTRLTS